MEIEIYLEKKIPEKANPGGFGASLGGWTRGNSKGTDGEKI